MAFAQTLDGANRSDQVAFRGLLGESDQGVRYAGKRRYDDDRSLVEARGDDTTCSLDRLGVSDRRPTELEDDHGRPISPRCTINSALSTEAPAAPRMTLWPMATSFTLKIGSERMRPTTTVMPLPV